jgi:hypothetical protein
MEPEIPMGSNPQIALTDGHKNGRLSDGVGVEIVELHRIVMREGTHKATRRHPKASLVESIEADHITRGWMWLVVVTIRHDPFRPFVIIGRAEQAVLN